MFKTKEHGGGNSHGRHKACSTGDPRRTSQTEFKAPSTSNARSRTAELETEIRLPLFASRLRRSDSCSVVQLSRGV